MRGSINLSWYERQGYDPNKIKEEITDTKVVKGLGVCYKVFIEGDAFESIDEQCHKKLMDMKDTKESVRAAKKEKASGASASTAVVAPACKRSRSSSSDSSSSTRHHRKKRKSERRAAEKGNAAEVELTPKELAERVAAANKEAIAAGKENIAAEKKKQQEDKQNAKIAELAEKKVWKERKDAAKKFALKLTPAIRNLQGALADPSIQHVPVFMQDSSKASLASCREVFEEMNMKKGQDKPAALSVDAEQVNKLMKTGLQEAKDVSESLALLLKLRKRGAEQTYVR